MERIKVSAAFIIVFISIDLNRRSFLWLPTWSRRGELDLYRVVALELQIGRAEGARTEGDDEEHGPTGDNGDGHCWRQSASG
jgi:hypothetical protein